MRKLGLTLLLILSAGHSWALSGDDNLGVWRSSSSDEQLSLCEAMLKTVEFPKVPPYGLQACINTVARGNFDQKIIGDVAAMCAILMTEELKSS